MNRRLALAAALALAPTLAHAAGGGEKKKGGGATFLQIQTLTAAVVRAMGGRGVVTMEVGIDIADDGLRHQAELSLPRLRAAFAGVLQGYASRLSPGSVPNADYLAQRMQGETDRILAKKGARLLIGTILVN